jgi:hypothetical protein
MNIVRNGAAISLQPTRGEKANGRVYDLQTGRQVVSLDSTIHVRSLDIRDKGKELPSVFDAAGTDHFMFSPDGRRAYAMAGAKQLNVYDTATGVLMAEIVIVQRQSRL